MPLHHHPSAYQQPSQAGDAVVWYFNFSSTVPTYGTAEPSYSVRVNLGSGFDYGASGSQTIKDELDSRCQAGWAGGVATDAWNLSQSYPDNRLRGSIRSSNVPSTNPPFEFRVDIAGDVYVTMALGELSNRYNACRCAIYDGDFATGVQKLVVQDTPAGGTNQFIGADGVVYPDGPAWTAANDDGARPARVLLTGFTQYVTFALGRATTNSGFSVYAHIGVEGII